MRFKVDIVNELTRADSGAVDHEIEFWINGFEFFELNIWVDFAAGSDESVCEIVEIDRGVHEWNIHRETRSKNSKRFLHSGRNDKIGTRHDN